MTASNGRVRPLDPRLLRYARSARTQVLVGAVLGTLTAVTVIAQAALIAQVVAGVMVHHASVATLVVPLAALICVLGLRAALSGLSEWAGQSGAIHVITQLRRAVLERVRQDDGRLTAGEGASSLTTLCTTGIDALEPYLTRYLPQLLMATIVTPLLLVTITWLDPLSGGLVAITLPLIPAFMALVGWSTAAMARRRLGTMSRLGAQLLDLVAGLATLRAHGRQRSQGAQIAIVGERHRRATMATLRQAFLSSMVLESFTTLSVALVAVGIGFRLVFGELDLQTGMTILILAPEVYLPLRMLGVHYHASVDGLAAAERVFAVLDPAQSVDPSPNETVAIDLRTATIDVSQVSIRRPGRLTLAPHALDLRLRPGEVVALVGPSGGGKSTALSVVLGLLPPSSGRVTLLVDGAPVPLRAADREQWYRQVSWVPQKPAVTPGTVLENLWLPGSSAGWAPPLRPSQLRIAELCGLREVVDQLPDGWSTQIGHGGFGLSAGQRQRLALTRTLLRDQAQLVLLDEPAAHLDHITERHLTDALLWLRAQGRTVLMVAHRPTLAAAADRMVSVRSAPDLELSK